MRLAMCLPFAALVSPVVADDRQDCGVANPDRRIEVCTALINSKREAGQNLAMAYRNRGVAHASKKDYDSAIADYSKAVEINPKYAAAYNDRALAYTNKGDFQRAVADVTRAVELDREAAGKRLVAPVTPVPKNKAAPAPTTAQHSPSPAAPASPSTTTAKTASGPAAAGWRSKVFEPHSDGGGGGGGGE
jgi:tetratricopeptide (TPR) repeat protein